jgi:hypothetical protein
MHVQSTRWKHLIVELPPQNLGQIEQITMGWATLQLEYVKFPMFLNTVAA